MEMYHRRELNLTPKGDYDMRNKKITNVSLPQDPSDSTTKQYVDDETGVVSKKLDRVHERLKNFEKKVNKYMIAQTDLLSEIGKLKERIEILSSSLRYK